MAVSNNISDLEVYTLCPPARHHCPDFKMCVVPISIQSAFVPVCLQILTQIVVTKGSLVSQRKRSPTPQKVCENVTSHTEC